MSAGNAGASFAKLSSLLGVEDATVIMPSSVPPERVRRVERLGASVKLVEASLLRETAERLRLDEGKVLVHPFDDIDLIAGHGSVGLEIMDQAGKQPLSESDIVAVCCGGGGLVAGVAAALKLSGCRARICAVEPENSRCMHRSMELGRPAVAPADFQMDTIAHGLSPPFAGSLTYEHCKEFVDDFVLVSDAEILDAMAGLVDMGFVCEPSGCAAFAAARSGKFGAAAEHRRIFAVVSGRNVSLQEASALLSEGGL